MPRAIGVAVALGLAVSLSIPPVAGLAGVAALADPGDPPSRQEVRDARAAAQDKARDVDAVQADLAAANERLQQSAIEAAQATEAWNGARYRLEQARQAASAADERAGIARTDVDRQQDAYADALVSSYEMSPTLTAVASMVQADGIGTVVSRPRPCRRPSRHSTAGTTASSRPRPSRRRGRPGGAGSRRGRRRSRSRHAHARDAARDAADAAAAEASAIASRKDELIAELADLQDISVGPGRAAPGRRSTSRRPPRPPQPPQPRQAAEQRGAGRRGRPGRPSGGRGAGAAGAAPQQPERARPHRPRAAATTRPPPPSGGAGAAVSFARAQLGEPYRVGRRRARTRGTAPASPWAPGHAGGTYAAPLLGRAVRAVDPDLGQQPAAG